MSKLLKLFVSFIIFVSTFPALASVTVTAPLSGSTVGPNVLVVASAKSTTCSAGISAIGIYVDNQRVYVTQGTNLSTTIPVALGSHVLAIQGWDFCKGSVVTKVTINVVAAKVTVSAPLDGAVTDQLTVPFKATAYTPCARGVASMGIYENGQLLVVNSTPYLTTSFPFALGLHNVYVQEWDFCGGSVNTPIAFSVVAAPPPPPPPAPTEQFFNIQASNPWSSWGQQGPLWQDCSPCAGDTWDMQQTGVLPSLSGSAAEFTLGGTAPYSDVLFANHLIGYLTSQGMPDTSQTIVPTLHHFVYSGDFYTTTGQQTYALELDVNSFPGGGVGMTFGTQCRIFGGNGWDVWNSQNWVQTGKACNPVEGGWNHFIIDVTRDSANNLIYNSITLNGVVNQINLTYPPFTVPTDWYGVTVNVQLDGDNVQDTTHVIVDNLTLSAS